MKDVILLADPNSPSWEFTKKIHDYIKQNKEVEIPIIPLNIQVFRNKEIMPFIDENIRKKNVYFIHSSNKNPNDWWVEMLLVKDLCLSASVKSLSFVLPNLYYSRQDRKTRSRVPISTRALGESISPGLKRIITMDLHAPQVQNAYPQNVPMDNLYSFPEVVKHVRKNHFDLLKDLVVVSPDAGGVDRAMSFLKRMIIANETDESKHNYSFAFTHKLRPRQGEIGKMHFIGEVKDKNVLIIDDIYDSGLTAIECARVLRENGAKKIIVYATHGLFTLGTKPLLENFDSVMTSNTLYFPKEEDGNIEVIDLTPLFAEAIYRAQRGLSVSKMFD